MSDLGDLPARQEPVAYAYTTPMGAAVVWRFALNDDVEADYLELGLWGGYGVFAPGIRDGTFVIEGDELNYSTCGACIGLLGDAVAVDSGLDPEAFYTASGGRLVLSSHVGRLTGEFSDLTFDHVEIDPDTLVSTPVGDGCTVRLGSLAFDVQIN